MRPLELTVEGFRSHRQRATFDWRGRRLVGIVGPIGSGKSSILDAISFALYGKTPAVEGATKTLIHQLCSESHVELRFEVDGQVWRAVRALRRKGQSGHQLERLATDEPGAEVLEQVTGDDPMKERVEGLLGMDFKAFCRSVLLAQNRFSEFLKATPAERDKVLKGVFGYERLDAALGVARSRLDRQEVHLEGLGREHDRIDEARERLEGARTAAATALERSRELSSAAPRVERLTDEIRSAKAAGTEADVLATHLEELVATLPPAGSVDEVAGIADGAADAVTTAEKARDEAAATRAEAEAILADVRARLGDRERFRSFERLVEQQEREALGRARAAEALDARVQEQAAGLDGLATLRTAAENGRAELARADDATAAAAFAVEEARAAVTIAQHAEMAHELQGGLVAGDPCPVCAQIVASPPKKTAAPRSAAARKRLTAAERAESEARRRKETAAATDAAARTAEEAAQLGVERSSGAVHDAKEAVAAAEAALTATQSQLADWLGEGDADAREALRAREQELEGAEAGAEAAKRRFESAREAVDLAREGATATQRALAQIANRLAGAWGRLSVDRDVAATPASVRTSFAEIAELIASRHEAAIADRAAAAERAEAGAASIRSLFVELGLAPDANFPGALTDAGVAHGAAAALVTELEHQIATASDVERQILEAEHARELAKLLTEDLKPSRFLGFLLQEERTELAELGSGHLEELTDGAYRFSDDDSFAIVDMNAASLVRKADSLSGGETFLASLALALALAEMVARGGGRLDSFFLDEGFGSLDLEHLDRAMDGIARLVAGDTSRLVVLVSHVEQMRQTLEDLIVLDKDVRTGDSVVVSGASPAV